MSRNSDQIKFHATSSGRLFIIEEEFFRTEKVKKIISQLLNSSIYKEIKHQQEKQPPKQPA